MTRREFIGTLGSATLVAGCELEDVERLVDDARTEIRLGVLAQTEIGWKESTGRLKKAFEFYRQEGVDAVVIAGGATANGHQNQLEVLRAAWTGVFGRTDKVRLILDEGRHEVGGFAFAVSRRCPVEKGDGLAFHAQGKKPLTNDLWFYDPEMRAVYAGSMSGVVVQAGYEFGGRLSDGKMTVPAAQGLLVSVYSSQIVIRRLDFTQSALPEGRGGCGMASSTPRTWLRLWFLTVRRCRRRTVRPRPSFGTIRNSSRSTAMRARSASSRSAGRMS